jgi:hypothetical protein
MRSNPAITRSDFPSEVWEGAFLGLGKTSIFIGYRENTLNRQNKCWRPITTHATWFDRAFYVTASDDPLPPRPAECDRRNIAAYAVVQLPRAYVSQPIIDVANGKTWFATARLSPDEQKLINPSQSQK